MVRAVRSLKVLVAAVEDTLNTAETWACETLDNMSDLRALFEGLNRTICGECAGVA